MTPALPLNPICYPKNELQRLEREYNYLWYKDLITCIATFTLGAIALIVTQKKFPKHKETIFVICAGLIYYARQFFGSEFLTKEKPLLDAIQQEVKLIKELDGEIDNSTRVLTYRVTEAKKLWLSMLATNAVTNQNSLPKEQCKTYAAIGEILNSKFDIDSIASTHIQYVGHLNNITKENHIEFRSPSIYRALKIVEAWCKYRYLLSISQNRICMDSFNERFKNHYLETTMQEREKIIWDPARFAICFTSPEGAENIHLRDLI